MFISHFKPKEETLIFVLKICPQVTKIDGHFLLLHVVYFTIICSRFVYLDKLPALAVYVVWQDALLMVPDGVVEEVAVLAEGGGGNVVDADVVEVALLRVGKQPIQLRADKVVHWTVEVKVFVSL